MVIAYLNLQKILKYGVITKKYDLIWMILWQKHMSQTIFKSKTTTKFWQTLNKTQKKVLFGYIRYLVIRKTLLIFGIIKNIIEKKFIKANWANSRLDNLYIIIHSIPKTYIYKISTIYKKRPNMLLYFSYFTIWYQ